jgi:hypothetical protein
VLTTLQEGEEHHHHQQQQVDDQNREGRRDEDADASGQQQGVAIAQEHCGIVEEQGKGGQEQHQGQLGETGPGAASPGHAGAAGKSSSSRGRERWYSWMELEELKSRVHLLMTSQSTSAAPCGEAGGSNTSSEGLTPAISQNFIATVNTIRRLIKVLGELVESGHLAYQKVEICLPPGGERLEVNPYEEHHT